MLIIVRGLPGSGKTTFARKLRLLHIELDMLRVVNGKYVYNRDKNKQVVDTMYDIVEKSLSLGSDIVVSNTFVKTEQIDKIAELGKKYGHSVIVMKLEGSYRSTKLIPENDLFRMRNEWQDYDSEITIFNG